MNWKEFKEAVENIVPPEGVEMDDWEVIITVKGERHHEFEPLGIDIDAGDDMGLESAIIIEARRQ